MIKSPSKGANVLDDSQHQIIEALLVNGPTLLVRLACISPAAKPIQLTKLSFVTLSSDTTGDHCAYSGVAARLWQDRGEGQTLGMQH